MSTPSRRDRFCEPYSVNVARGARAGDLVEVFGPLNDGDEILRRATDEIREGTKVQVATRQHQ
jgi:hypothetical protein